MLPPAPVTFSMTIGWPRMALSRSPRKRASTSVAPPAANGTITVIGLDGEVCAESDPTPHRTAMPIAASAFPIMMPSLLLDAGRFDDRPPDRDVGLLLRHQRLGRLLLAGRDLHAQGG